MFFNGDKKKYKYMSSAKPQVPTHHCLHNTFLLLYNVSFFLKAQRVGFRGIY